jgi:hypothetical protein
MSQRAALLKSEFELAKMVFDATTGDLTEEVAGKRVEGANIGAILPIYAHAVFGLDAMVNRAAAGGQALLESGNWAQRTGIAAPSMMQTPEWAENPFKLEGLREYSAAVFASLFAYLDGATDADLDKEVPSPISSNLVPVSRFLGGLGMVHLCSHTGEIAALKGVHGLRGLPF